MDERYLTTIVRPPGALHTGNMTATSNSSPVRRAPYLAALRSELGDNGAARRATALLNQRVLFPHRGEAVLDEEALHLSTWTDDTDLTITRDTVSRITRQFDDFYGAFVGGGSSAWGAPVIIEFTDGTAIYLLFDHKAFLEKTTNPSWEKELLSWLSA